MNNKHKSKYFILVRFFTCVMLVCGMIMCSLLSGCGKKKNIPMFSYTITDTGQVNITGFTDKGKTAAKVTIPATIEGKPVVKIESGAFRESPNLKEVVFEEGVEQIAENAFLSCTNLENITFPASLKSVGTNIIKNTAWEKKQYESADIIVVNDILVSAKENIAKCEVPDGVRYIASGAFYRNTNLSDVKLPGSLEIIESYAFSGCTALKRIEFTDNLKIIGYGAFSDCEQLTVTVPASVRSIGTDAFLNVKEVIEK